MAKIFFEPAHAVVFDLPPGVDARPAAAAVGRRRSASAAAPDNIIDTALEDAQFTILQDVILEPASRTDRRRTRALDVTSTEESGTSATLEVEIAPGEDAVVLMQGAGDVFTWIWPEESTVERAKRRGPADRSKPVVRVFTLDTLQSGSGRGRRSLIGWFADQLLEPIRVRVLKYIASAAIDLALARIEGDMKTGLVAIGEDPKEWVAGAALPQLPTDRPARVLLMVHGSFSSTVGAFSGLTKTEEGRGFLKMAREKYDAVLGFDHKTLAEDPDQNASAIMDVLQGLPRRCSIDAVAHSRGGLVFRALAERFAPQRRPDLQFGDAVFVGCTNRGTLLAEPDNWKVLIDFYTNAVMAAGRFMSLIGGPAIPAIVSVPLKLIGGFVQALPQVAISEAKVPGLAAMEPDGRYVSGLDAETATLSGDRRYFVISSNFEPRIDPSKGITGELAEFLIDRIADRLLGESNDLVVHVRSMSDFGNRRHFFDEARLLQIAPTKVIYHTIYFAAAEVATQLAAWLIEGRVPATERDASKAPPTRMVRTSSPVREAPPRTKGAGPGVRTRGFERAPPAKESSRSPRRRHAEELEADAGDDEFQPPQRDTESVEAPSPAAAEPVACNFAAEMNPTPKLKRPVPLFVTVSREAIAVEASAASKVGEKSIDIYADVPIRIDVVPLVNCETVGDSSCELQTPGPGRPASHRFLVQGFKAGGARIQVEARQGPKLLASFLLEPIFVEETDQRLSASQTATVSSSLGRQPAVLRIFQTFGADGSLTLRYDLSSIDPRLNEVQNVTLPRSFDLGKFVGDFLTKVERAYSLSQRVYEEFESRTLEFSADSTNNLIPEGIRRVLWQNRDKIAAIQVVTDEPYIPWEMLCITDPDNPDMNQARFLCEWGLVRWFYNTPWPREELPLRGDKVRYVIPEYLNERDRLAGAAEERQMLNKLFQGAAEISATRRDVSEFLKSDAAKCDLLHFACHGQTKQDGVLDSDLLMKGIPQGSKVVEDVVQYQTVQLNARFGPLAPSGLVFINACQTGRGGQGISGVAGFAKAFLQPTSRQGAAAFLGALWSVDDVLALNFAETFYSRLLAGDTLAESVTNARKTCKARGDFTWLAYSVYGAPFARATS